MSDPHDNASTARVLLADDHPIFIEGLRRLLTDTYDVVGAASNGKELIELAGDLDPDVIVADYSMPDLTGVEAALAIRESGGRAKFVIMTMHQDVDFAHEAIARGVDGYVLKQSAPDHVSEAIKTVLTGGRWLSPSLGFDLLKDGEPNKVLKPHNPFDVITPRRRQILRGLLAGKVAKEIAADLNLSRKTVEYHKYRMMSELGVETSTELLRLALKHGVDEDENFGKI